MRTLTSSLILFAILTASFHATGREFHVARVSSTDIFTFNTYTMKYHRRSCKWAKRCTVNCIDITRDEAIRRGGTRCKVCGGR